MYVIPTVVFQGLPGKRSCSLLWRDIAGSSNEAEAFRIPSRRHICSRPHAYIRRRGLAAAALAAICTPSDGEMSANTSQIPDISPNIHSYWRKNLGRRRCASARSSAKGYTRGRRRRHHCDGRPCQRRLEESSTHTLTRSPNVDSALLRRVVHGPKYLATPPGAERGGYAIPASRSHASGRNTHARLTGILKQKKRSQPL